MTELVSEVVERSGLEESPTPAEPPALNAIPTVAPPNATSPAEQVNNGTIANASRQQQDESTVGTVANTITPESVPSTKADSRKRTASLHSELPTKKYNRVDVSLTGEEDDVTVIKDEPDTSMMTRAAGTADAEEDEEALQQELRAIELGEENLRLQSKKMKVKVKLKAVQRPHQATRSDASGRSYDTRAKRIEGLRSDVECRSPVTRPVAGHLEDCDKDDEEILPEHFLLPKNSIKGMLKHRTMVPEQSAEPGDQDTPEAAHVVDGTAESPEVGTHEAAAHGTLLPLLIAQHPVSSAGASNMDVDSGTELEMSAQEVESNIPQQHTAQPRKRAASTRDLLPQDKRVQQPTAESDTIHRRLAKTRCKLEAARVDEQALTAIARNMLVQWKETVSELEKAVAVSRAFVGIAP